MSPHAEQPDHDAASCLVCAVALLRQATAPVPEREKRPEKVANHVYRRRRAG